MLIELGTRSTTHYRVVNRDNEQSVSLILPFFARHSGAPLHLIYQSTAKLIGYKPGMRSNCQACSLLSLIRSFVSASLMKRQEGERICRIMRERP